MILKKTGLSLLVAALVCSSVVAYAQKGNFPNWRANPVFTTANLSSGFMPDPWSYSIQAGGSQEVQGLGSSCVGYINYQAPDIDLNYEAGGILGLYVYVRSDSDTTLVINGPDGRWYCNDDADGLNPMVHFPNPEPGMYNIWVGTYSSGNLQQATVNISELNPSN
ncbi:MAG: hypothetical protein HLUCCO02_02415 [Idiomarinaceae bacterium HL-53]|nr:MAG: hypothetical protein HLUCCO02_02415 [Idiomarinaceae bacterium HL-53]CUS48874.1 hypothetical protein Ga0003345_1854 [Idiomarinaceae bacterium HL-53]